MKNIFRDNLKLGFGMMRLPMVDDEVDYQETNLMVDEFIKAGFSYFDTAKGYLGGKSEIALRECVVKRYPRESFTITDKLTMEYFTCQEDIRVCFEAQLKAVGVDYFDYYLMHSQGSHNYAQYQQCHAYEVAQQLKVEGKIKHVGISFHDSADFLDMILTQHPEIELVQIQLNYVDYDDEGVQSRKCLEVCQRHDKPVVVMEPIKGGNLVNLPQSADDILRSLGGGSNASYAVRFACSFSQVRMVLSGMSNLAQMKDNISYMVDFEPLNEQERESITQVCEIFKSQHLIQCTACKYCVDGCPMKILIPNLFADMNAKVQYKDWNSNFYYHKVHTKVNGKASACIKCGKCELVCPQHLPIRQLLEQVAEQFEKK